MQIYTPCSSIKFVVTFFYDSVFEHLDIFPTACTPSSTCSLLNECSLLKCTSVGNKTEYTMKNSVPHFRYFGLTGPNNGLLLSLLEQNLGNEQGNFLRFGT